MTSTEPRAADPTDDRHPAGSAGKTAKGSTPDLVQLDVADLAIA